MSADDRAIRRYFVMTGVRIAGVAGAVFGLILVGRATTLEPKVVGTALVIAALVMIAIVPRSLARRWRTPPDA